MDKKKEKSRIRFELQEKILGHVCYTRDAGYDTLVNDDFIRGKRKQKDRATIIQALRPLIKKAYVAKSEKRIEARNIEVVFRPTPKGIFYALAFLGLELKLLLQAYGDEDDVTQYAQLLGAVVDASERDRFMVNTAKAILDFDLFDKKGELKISHKQELFNVGFISALTGIARSKSPSTAVDFNKLPQLARILTRRELEEVSEFYGKALLVISQAEQNFRKELCRQKSNLETSEAV